MGLYNKQGLYLGYKKNNKERAAYDYYASPSCEVTNILEVLGLNLHGATILEPCAGGGHMLEGIRRYCLDKEMIPERIFASDIKKCARLEEYSYTEVLYGEQADFLSDEYPFNKADYVIMNPPYSTIEPFVIRGLEIAQKGMLLLGRLQFLEGQSRYKNILKDTPPSDVYVYIDRIKCGKNGDFLQTESSAQAYAWFYWNKEKENKTTELHWIRRVND